MNSNQVDIAKDFAANLLDNRVVVEERKGQQKDQEFNMMMDHQVRKREQSNQELKSVDTQQQMRKEQRESDAQKQQDTRVTHQNENKQRDVATKLAKTDKQKAEQKEQATEVRQAINKEMKKEEAIANEVASQVSNAVVAENDDDQEEVVDNLELLNFLYINNLLISESDTKKMEDPSGELSMSELQIATQGSVEDVLTIMDTDVNHSVTTTAVAAEPIAIEVDVINDAELKTTDNMINQLDDQVDVGDNNRYQDLLREIHYAANQDSKLISERSEAMRQTVAERIVLRRQTQDADYQLNKTDLNIGNHNIVTEDRGIKVDGLNLANQQSHFSDQFSSNHDRMTHQLMNDAAQKIDKVSGTQRNYEIRPVHYQVQEAIKVGIREDKNHMTIRLDPPEWGSIKIVLDHKNGDLNINLTTGQEFVKLSLDRNMQELREGLKQLDIQLGSLDVQVDLSSGKQHQENDEYPNAVTPMLFAENKEMQRKRKVKSDAIVDDIV